MLGQVALLVAGLVGLFYGGNWLVRGASNLALSFGVSVLIIALTFVAIGTSMPEMLVSLQAALAGKSDLAVGNVIGSNIANIGLILGATGLIAPLSVKAILLRREIPLMILVSALAAVLTIDGQISRLDGAPSCCCHLSPSTCSSIGWRGAKPRRKNVSFQTLRRARLARSADGASCYFCSPGWWRWSWARA